MKPVNQIIQHNPPETWGDCYRACVASILELSCEDVPHVYADGEVDGARKRMRKFLNSLGWFVVEFGWNVSDDYSNAQFFKDMRNMIDPELYFIVSGRGSFGGKHCVVYKSGRPVHDPQSQIARHLKPDNSGSNDYEIVVIGKFN